MEYAIQIKHVCFIQEAVLQQQSRNEVFGQNHLRVMGKSSWHLIVVLNFLDKITILNAIRRQIHQIVKLKALQKFPAIRYALTNSLH